MRTSTAYFAGIGTVVFAVAAGLGGGYLAANVVSPHEPKYGTETSRLERRMASQPIPVTTAPSEPVPYIAATTVAAANPATTPARAEPQTAASTPAAPAEEKTASNNPAPVQTAPSAPPPAKPAEQASEKTTPSQEAFAKARDADMKRAAVEQRRAERRQRWAEKRRFREPREQDLGAVEEKVREVTEPGQAFVTERVRIESPRIRLFGQD
jgi:hypothetical protein